MTEKIFDIVVVGAGAAGLMTSIWAGRTRKASVLLVDTKEKIGAKILMSGGTRCNVTNKEVKTADFHGGPGHFVKHVFEAFTPKETIQFFKELGVELVLEPTGKYFPVTHSAETVLDGLVRETQRLGILLKTGLRIVNISKKGDLFYLKAADGTQLIARKLVLTTGGLSHPTTGSDGAGYEMAKNFGHTIEPTFAALTPLLTNDSDWKSLSGVTLKTKLSFFRNGEKECDYTDSFLFTHFGFSGPVALDISRFVSGTDRNEKPEIKASFLPKYREESLKAELQSIQKKNPNKLFKKALSEDFGLPARFVEIFLKKIKIEGSTPLRNRSPEIQRKLIHAVLNYPLEITGVFGYQKAEITAGGVSLKEIKVQTMESKLTEGLYFSGEIMDVDGRIGGFNFQWAWSTGAIAGKSVAKSIALHFADRQSATPSSSRPAPRGY